MTDETYIQDNYLDWIYRKVIDEEPDAVGFHSLLEFLHSVSFIYDNPFDENRYEDAIGLRYRYGDEEGVFQGEIQRYLSRDATVLEMMAALAIRMEEHIMHNDDLGDRTPEWFYLMLDSMGLSYMDDYNFNAGQAARIVDKFLDHEYAPDGRGGLFYIPGIDADLREEEIWCQMCWCLNTMTEKGSNYNEFSHEK